MLEPRLFLEAGYRAHRTDNYVANNTFYQKVIRDGGAKLYYLNVTFWYFEKAFPGRGAKTQISCEARLYWPAENTLTGSAGFQLELYLEDTTTVAKIEAFYAFAYRALQCVPDLHNND
jgi:hypothetical protein